jgi:hypothetical protein
MGKVRYATARDVIIRAIRSGRPRALVERLMRSLFHSAPGFRGVRSQIGHLAALCRAEWKRRRGNESEPTLPRRLGYVRRLTNRGTRLRQLKKRFESEVSK